MMSDDENIVDSNGFVKFPSIGHLKTLCKEVPFVKFPDDVDLHAIEYEGTVKLHGSHWDLVSDSFAIEFQPQSRNRILTPEADNCGFAKFAIKNWVGFTNLFQIIRERSGGKHVMISGEICGPGVQSGVGISAQKEKFVVIFNVKVDNKWQAPEVWADLEDRSNRIFNIRRFQMFNIVIDMTDAMTSFEAIEEMTKQVGADCPVARSLGTPGTGEGIVWIPKDPSVALQSRLWFKSKTEEHMVTPARNKEPKPLSNSTLAAIEFVDDNLTQARLKQGLDHLREFQMQPDMKNLGTFLKWLADDILKEEGRELSADVVKAGKKIIAQRGREWYIRQSS